MIKKILLGLTVLGLITAAFFVGGQVHPRIVEKKVEVSYTPDDCVNALVSGNEYISKLQEGITLIGQLGSSSDLLELVQLNAQAGALVEEIKRVKERYESDVQACASVENRITV